MSLGRNFKILNSFTVQEVNRFNSLLAHIQS